MSETEAPSQDRQPAVTSWNSAYVDDLYKVWQADPASVDHSWQMFFKGFEMAMCPRNCVAADRANLQSKVASLIYAYRSQGHLIAQIDPLGSSPTSHPDLEPESFGFNEEHLDQVYDTGHLVGPKRATLRELIQYLRTTYCGSIGVQYTHIQDTNVRRWLQQEMEPNRNYPNLDDRTKLDILSTLYDAEMFEKFIGTKYVGQKRFSLEGAETLIPAVHALVDLAPELGVKEIVVGMPHRGRLNMLANVFDKSFEMIFSEFEGVILPDTFGGDGDVKYHLGISADHKSHRSGENVHLSLTANPSHLEAVDPVVLGKVRAKQRQLDRMINGVKKEGHELDRSRVLPLLIHGDAAFAGQGLVAETLNMSQLKGYSVGGTLHFIVNNQIGFTTDPTDSRSSAYCTDVAKMIEAPIFHVNGDEPESVVYAIELALKFRQKFGRDVVVDMLCYRRHGHNEGDEPMFTQPIMYRKIKKRPSVRKIYEDKLVDSGTISRKDAQALADEDKEKLQKAFEKSSEEKIDLRPHAFDLRWTGLDAPFSSDAVSTKVSKKKILEVAKALTTVPEGFDLNPKIARQLPARLDAAKGKGVIDWSFAEALAFGTLLIEGTPVRLSGQDSERGTFSQRHSVWRDINSMTKHTPLNHIRPDQDHFCVYNSPLSEASILGFDYGYSLAEPRMLIMWEAQFGDFANGAQVIIDQFISSSGSKWNRFSGLVMLLPHGYEGQGPEHSNAYLERYLAACAQENIQVCNLTTPAQYFHVLRRQIKRKFRRPLIIMSPKSMLRNKLAVSKLEDLTTGAFMEILDDPKGKSDAKRLILCSGKLYHELDEYREEKKVTDVALVRIEQLYPINNELMTQIRDKYRGIEEIIWAQEEPKNRGSWTFIRPWLQYLFPDTPLRYVGRGFAASPATGSLYRYRDEQARIIHAALLGERTPYDVTILPEGIKQL